MLRRFLVVLKNAALPPAATMYNVIILCVLVAYSVGQIIDPPPADPPIPVPATYPGQPYNRSTTVRAPITLEAYVELGCGDSAYAFTELTQVAAHYGSEQLDLIYHQLPLPYPRNAFLQAQVRTRTSTHGIGTYALLIRWVFSVVQPNVP